MRIAVAVMGARGRVVVPAEVRAALGVAPGDTLFFLVEGDRVRLARAPEDFGEYLELYGPGRPEAITDDTDVEDG